MRLFQYLIVQYTASKYLHQSQNRQKLDAEVLTIQDVCNFLKVKVSQFRLLESPLSDHCLVLMDLAFGNQF